MQYFGGKQKIGKELADFINPYIDDKLYVEPFCGALGVLQHINAKVIFAYDINKSLIEMWKALIKGWIPPSSITEQQYEDAKNYHDGDPLKAFIGFGCSFGGKYFGGYARNAIKHNYALGARNSLLKKLENIKNKDIIFGCEDYKNLTFDGYVIYADPPYNETTAFKGTPKLDSEQFWDFARIWKQNNKLFISEYSAPNDFECCWEKQMHDSLRTKNRTKKIERLYR